MRYNICDIWTASLDTLFEYLQTNYQETNDASFSLPYGCAQHKSQRTSPFPGGVCINHALHDFSALQENVQHSYHATSAWYHDYDCLLYVFMISNDMYFYLFYVYDVPQTKKSSQDMTQFSEMSISLRLLGHLVLLPRKDEQNNTVSKDYTSFNHSITIRS